MTSFGCFGERESESLAACYGGVILTCTLQTAGMPRTGEDVYPAYLAASVVGKRPNWMLQFLISAA